MKMVTFSLLSLMGSPMLVEGANQNGNGNNGNLFEECKTYTIDSTTILQNSGVFRSAKIDSLSPTPQCANIATFAGGALGATFCAGDTFSIAASPFFDADGVEEGYYTRSGMRVSFTPPLLVGNAFNAFVFTNGDQLHFQSVDQAGSPLLISSIAGGTGDFVGAKGTVTITNFLSTTQDSTFEVCILS